MCTGWLQIRRRIHSELRQGQCDRIVEKLHGENDGRLSTALHRLRDGERQHN